MAYTAEQLADLLFKKVIAGKATTDSSKAFFEEAINSRKSIFSSDIWNQSDIIQTTAPVIAADVISGVVQFKENIPLIPIPGTNAFTTGISNIIPFNFGDGSYNYILKDGTGGQIAPGTADWLLDAESGVITFFDGGATFNTIVGTGTLTLTVYIYVGTKGVSAGGSSGLSSAGWLAPVISKIDNTVFEAIITPSNGERYLITSSTNAVVTVHDIDTGNSSTNNVIPANSILEYFDDAGNAGADAGWIIDFNGSSPLIGSTVTVVDEPGNLSQYHTNTWNTYSFEKTLPSREYKGLQSALVLVDGGEMTTSSLPGGLLVIPTAETYVEITINGVQVSVEDSINALASITEFCYFSDDGGLNSKDLSQLAVGDRLYWMPSNSGYELETIDSININFVSNQ